MRLVQFQRARAGGDSGATSGGAGAGAGAGSAAAAGGEVHVGAELADGAGIVDLTSAFAATSGAPNLAGGMKSFLCAGDAALAAARAAVKAKDARFVVPAAEAKLVAPIYDPEKMLCVGMNYVDHCEEQGFPIPKVPIIFNKFPSCIVGDGDDIVKPKATEKLDFEVEMVIVIGKGGRNIRRADAMTHVAGYTVAHDVSARDWQLERNGAQWLLGKTFDTFGPIGPAIVTADAVEDPHSLPIRCWLNDKAVQDSNTNQLIFKTDYLVEFISQFVTLKAGDLILTGTPPGVGCFREPPMYLVPGDVVTCEVEGIGSITNKVVAEPGDMTAARL